MALLVQSSSSILSHWPADPQMKVSSCILTVQTWLFKCVISSIAILMRKDLIKLSHLKLSDYFYTICGSLCLLSSSVTQWTGSSEAARQALANITAASSASCQPLVLLPCTTVTTGRIGSTDCGGQQTITAARILPAPSECTAAESHHSQSVAYVTWLRNPLQRTCVGEEGKTYWHILIP